MQGVHSQIVVAEEYMSLHIIMWMLVNHSISFAETTMASSAEWVAEVSWHACGPCLFVESLKLLQKMFSCVSNARGLSLLSALYYSQPSDWVSLQNKISDLAGQTKPKGFWEYSMYSNISACPVSMTASNLFETVKSIIYKHQPSDWCFVSRMRPRWKRW